MEVSDSKDTFWGLFIFYTCSQGVTALVSASAAETRGLVYIRVVKYGIKTIDSKKDNKDDTNKLIAMTSL